MRGFMHNLEIAEVPNDPASIECRTMPLATEVIYISIGVMPFLVAIALVIAATVTGQPLALIPAGMFTAIGVWNFPRLVLRPATWLEFSPHINMLSWRNSIRHGEIPGSSVNRIEHRPRRAALYRIVMQDGSTQEFWLVVWRREDQAAVFDLLKQTNPHIDVSDFFRRRRIWRGLG
jgi:hypothetical protein